MSDGQGAESYDPLSSGARKEGSSVADGFFRRVVEDCPDGVFVAGRDGRVVFANEAIGDLLGYPPDALEGEPLSRIVPDPPARHRDLFAAPLDPEGLPPADEGPVSVRARAADGTDRRVSVSFASCDHAGERLLAGIVRDESDHRRTERRLERYETLLDAVDDGIYVLDSNFRILEVNEAIVSMTGYDREALVGSHASMLAGEDVLEEAARLSADLLHSDREAATITTDLTTADGDELPIETRFSLYSFDDGRHGQVGVVRDVTDRKQYEETLTALHRSTRRLLGASSDREIGRVLVDAATDVVDLSTAVVYRFDVERNVLSPAVASGVDGGVDALSDVAAGDHPCWTAFVEDRWVTVDGDEPAGEAAPVVPGTYVPLDDQGLFVAGTGEDGAIDDETRTIVDLLAANVEAALDRAEQEEMLRDREAELTERNRRLRRLDGINEVIRNIDSAVVEADTIEEIASEVCNRLVGSEWFDFAWIGEPDPVDDELRPQAWAGDGGGYLDTVDLALEGDAPDADAEPAVRATRTGELTRVSNVAEDVRAGRWRRAALSRDLRSVVSIPLRYGELTHGVLSVYAGCPAATDEMIRTVLDELGETIGNAMNAVETKQTLLADSGIELTLRFDAAEDPIYRLAQSTSSRIQFRSVVPQGDDPTRIYFTIAGADPDRVLSFGDRSVDVGSIRSVAERESVCVFEAEVLGGSIASLLADHGAAVQTMSVDDAGMRTTVELPPNADVRSFVTMVRSRYPGAELIGRRRNERPIRTRTGFRAGIEEQLSDRQSEVLRIAYHSGYFEWPRDRTAEEIADSLGISQPTISRHLRVGQRKLLSMLYD